MEEHSIRFLNERMNQQFLRLLIGAGVPFRVDAERTVYFSADDDDVIENELAAKVRRTKFPRWQLLSCPHDWTERYENYMTRRDIPFVRELLDGELYFLLPNAYRPHTWKLEEAHRTVS
ncbi:MAG TPA: hypothetical protein VGE52_15535 [Pirellulales bacterium]